VGAIREAPTLGYPLGMRWHCPICRKPTDSETHAEFPFCSEQCKLVDLGNWSSEKYVISEPVIDESMPENPERDTNEHKN
jgi:hypothetical protein